MANLADLQSRIESAVAAMDASNWESAITLAEGALLLMVAMPDSIFDGNDQIRFDRIGATQILNSIKRRANAQIASNSGAGFGSYDVEYTRG